MGNCRLFACHNGAEPVIREAQQLIQQVPERSYIGLIAHVKSVAQVDNGHASRGYQQSMRPTPASARVVNKWAVVRLVSTALVSAPR